MYPLDDLYQHAGRPLPAIEVTAVAQLPEPFRRLLAHTRSMTSTLEQFHATRADLRVISRKHRGDWYSREVLLVGHESGIPMEFGAVTIDLTQLPQPARDQILLEVGPIGRILRECLVDHRSRPAAYFSVVADAFLTAALNLSGRQVLYGRRNVLVNASNHAFADVVEILPPLRGDVVAAASIGAS